MRKYSYSHFRYGFGFGDQGDDFIGWSGFATKGDLFEADGLYSGGSFAHFFYYFCVLNLVPSIVAGLYRIRFNMYSINLNLIFSNKVNMYVILIFRRHNHGSPQVSLFYLVLESFRTVPNWL